VWEPGTLHLALSSFSTSPFAPSSQTRRRGRSRRIEISTTPQRNPLSRTTLFDSSVPSPHDSSAGILAFLRARRLTSHKHNARTCIQQTALCRTIDDACLSHQPADRHVGLLFGLYFVDLPMCMSLAKCGEFPNFQCAERSVKPYSMVSRRNGFAPVD
jgi:hypothetical protein